MNYCTLVSNDDAYNDVDYDNDKSSYNTSTDNDIYVHYSNDNDYVDDIDNSNDYDQEQMVITMMKCQKQN